VPWELQPRPIDQGVRPLSLQFWLAPTRLAGYLFMLVDQEHDPQAYAGASKTMFQEVFDNEFAAEFKKRNLTYEHR